MTRIEKINYRKKLIENNESYCNGSYCNGKVKQLGEFPKNRYHECKECQNYRKKQLYKKNGTACWREKTRLKHDKSCEKCGCNDIELLEFDHNDPTEKSFTIARSSSAKKIIKEAEKTKFLCVWCHRLRTQKDINNNIKKPEEDYKYTEEEEAEEIDPIHSKTCTGTLCGGKKRNHKKFYKRKYGHCSRCIKCFNYNNMLIRRKNAKMIDDEKLKIGKCNECSIQVTVETLCCFDFDHLDQETKTCTMASLRLISRHIDEKIKTELKKCQLLCCKCHKKKTIKQLNYWDISKEAFSDYDQMTIKEKKIYMCPVCNKNEMDRGAKACLKCHLIKSRKVTRPSFEILESEVAEHGYVHTGKKYGVSDGAIRKWLKWYVLHENKTLTKIQMKI